MDELDGGRDREEDHDQHGDYRIETRSIHAGQEPDPRPVR